MMAIARLGPITSAVSGRVGGVSFRATPGGAVLSKQPSKTKPHSQAQLAARARKVTTALEWAALDLPTQLQWATAARSYTTRDRLGTPRTLTPSAFFSFCRNHRQDGELDTTPATPSPNSTLSITDVGASVGYPTTFSITIIPAAPDYSYTTQIWASIVYRADSAKHPKYWHWVKSVQSVDGPAVIFTPLLAALGTLQVGDVVHLKLVRVNLQAPPSPPYFASFQFSEPP